MTPAQSLMAGPAGPPAPSLVASSDTGRSASDNITNDNTPRFRGTTQANQTVEIMQKEAHTEETPVAIGSGVADSQGSYIVEIESPLADEIYEITAKVGGQTSATALEITIDTQAPSTPKKPDLDDSSDTGSNKGDSLTSDRTPLVNGIGAESRSVVRIFDGTRLLTETEASRFGRWGSTLPRRGFGLHPIKIQLEDDAGNRSPFSAALNLSIAPACFGEPATKFGNGAANTLTGTPGADVIHGMGGPDTINGRGGPDLLCGSGGDDTLLGGGGSDKFDGGGGRDFCDGSRPGSSPGDAAKPNCEDRKGIETLL